MDTNALIWFANGDPMLSSSLDVIRAAQQKRRVYVSAISAWEISLAAKKMEQST